MRTVSRYLLVQFAGASAAALAALAATLLATDALLRLDEFSEDPALAARHVLSRAVDLLPHVVPLAAVLGVVWSLSRAVRHREVTAIRCGGIPLRSALLPILVACIAVAGTLVLVEDRLVVPARRALVMPDEAPELHRPVQHQGRLWLSSGDWVLSARDGDGDTSRLGNVTAFEFDPDRRIRRRVDAESARHIEGRRWEFEGATAREFAADGSLALQTLERVELDLGFSGQDLARALPAPEMLTLHRLARQIREAADQGQVAVAETTFHARLARSLWALVLVLFTVPIALGDVERGDSLPRALIAAIAVTATFWLAWTAVQFGAQRGALPPAAALWGLTGAALLLGAWRFRAIRE